ncbi:MATE family efflux transporter [Sphingosinicellaceae bacterium]|nr:MATE family efflux transporter [Sphingosinicellaceae bacterium]
MTAAAATLHLPIRLSTLLRLAGPVVLSRLGIMTMGLVDTIVVGRHSGVELGYLALAWAPTGIVLTTSIGLLSGVQVLTSQAIGEGRREDTGAVLRRGLIYSALIGIVAAALLIVGGPWFLHHVGVEASLADGATPVLVMLALSLLPILVGDAGIFWLEAHGRPVPGAVVMWASNVVNLALNLWLVPGRSPFAVEGAVAASYATLISRIAFLIMVAVAILGWHEAKSLGVLKRHGRDRGAEAALRRIGYAASLSYFVEAGAFQAMTIVAGWLGATAVAAWAVTVNVAALIFMLPLGLATATGVLVGRAYGAGDRVGVRRAGVLGFRAVFGLLLIVCAIVGFGNHAIAAAYTHDPAIRVAAASALLLSCLFYVADGLQVVGSQSLRAQNDIWAPTATHFFSYLVVMIPACILLAITAGLGVDGIVLGVVIASLVSAALLIGRFWWKVRGHG